VLRTLLTGPADVRAQLGARGRAFVETWHRPETVAARVAADYERAVGARRVHGRRPTPR
jgi:hypothetical protein